jgi:light-regulated signal transduction histidine kinase (bacteriophytochrome)
MKNSAQDRVQDRAEDEIQRLRKALDEETGRCLDVQQQLDRANAEIEEFVSMAVHHLREPLRDVAIFSELLAGTCAGRLDPEAGGFLDRIQEGAARMLSLLADVVDYWSASTGNRESSPADMEAVLRQALLGMDHQIAERSAIVTHDPLPRVYGDFEILVKILRHLIRNAIEYCDQPSPRVHISCWRDDPDWVFSVQDKGPGIDPTFQRRLFTPFRRLHGKEYPGNGLALAFCKKAIEWHGGRMWMDSAPGVGSTFYFTAPPTD